MQILHRKDTERGCNEDCRCRDCAAEAMGAAKATEAGSTEEAP